MKYRLLLANIFAAVMLALYGSFTILSSMVIVIAPSLPYPIAVTGAILYLFGFGLPVLIYAVYVKKLTLQKVRETLSFRRLPILSILIVLAIAVFIQPVMSLIAQVSAMFFNDITTVSIEGMTDMPLWLLILTSAVLPAVFEELVCRGMLMDGYKDTPVWYQILIPGLFFGFLHLNFQQISYAAVMGIYFAIILLITRSIWATMIMHLTINGMQTAMAWLLENTHSLDSLVAFEENLTGTGEILPTLMIAVPCLLIVVFLTLILVHLHKVKDRPKRALQPEWHRGGWIMYLLIGFLFILSMIVELMMPVLSQFM